MGRGNVFKAFTLLAPIIAVSTSGCVTTPPLSQATGSERSDIMIKDVVQRVKCELSDAFDDKIDHPEFAWLGAWTAHADLSLAVNDNVGLSPTGSFIDYRTNGSAGTAKTSGGALGSYPVVQQFFSVAVGANLSGQAVRTETVSFTIGLDELQAWRKGINQKEASLPPEKRTCNFAPSMGVTGNLGLKEWVDSAFYPVTAEELSAGIHKSDWKTIEIPDVWGPKPFNFDAHLRQSLAEQRIESRGLKARRLERETAPAESEDYKRLKEWQDGLKSLQNAIRESTSTIASSSERIRTSALTVLQKLKDNQKYKSILPASLKQRYNAVDAKFVELLRRVEKCNDYKRNLDNALAYLYEMVPSVEAACLSSKPDSGAAADDKAAASPASCPKLDKILFAELEKKMEEFKNGSYESGAAICANRLTPLADYVSAYVSTIPTQVDPPIDSVLHSLQFVVNTGAGVTPSWTLLQWKGPGQSSNFFSASSVRTHNLQLALGPRTGSAAISSDATRLIQNQAVKSLGN